MANILSIQSHVTFGHVGNSAVVLPLQRLGHDVWPVPTVVLSNHAGYPDYGGCAMAPPDLAAMIDALDRRGVLARCDVVLSGYLGDSGTGDVVLAAVARVRARSADALYVCDPVMGDDGGLYVVDGIARFFRERAAAVADVLTPNLFELTVLTGRAPETLAGAPLADIIAAARELLAPERTTSAVLITSVAHAGLDPAEVAMLAVTRDGAWSVTTPKLTFAAPVHGAGDCCAALFAAALLDDRSAAAALSRTASAIFSLLDTTAQRELAELAMVAAQDAMIAPARTFRAVAVT